MELLQGKHTSSTQGCTDPLLQNGHFKHVPEQNNIPSPSLIKGSVVLHLKLHTIRCEQVTSLLCTKTSRQDVAMIIPAGLAKENHTGATAVHRCSPPQHHFWLAHVCRKHCAAFPRPITSTDWLALTGLPALSHGLIHIKSRAKWGRAFAVCQNVVCNQQLPLKLALLKPSSPCLFIKGFLVSLVFKDCFQSWKRESHQLRHASPDQQTLTRKGPRAPLLWPLPYREWETCLSGEYLGLYDPALHGHKGDCRSPGQMLCTDDTYGTCSMQGQMEKSLSQHQLGPPVLTRTYSSNTSLNVAATVLPSLPLGNYYWH